VILSNFLDSKDVLLRAKSTIGIGRLAFIVGKEKYAPYLEKISQKILTDLQKWELFEMAEAAYNYFGEIARMLGKEFAPMIPMLIPLALKSCMSEEGIKKEFAEKEQKDFSLDSDSEEDPDLKGITVGTAFLDEKNAALHCLGMCAIACPKEFLPHMPTCIQMLESIWNYFNENVRYQVVQTYQQFVESLNLAFYGTESHPKPTMGIPSTVKMAPDAYKFWYETVLPRYLHILETEEEREVVAKVLESLSDLAAVIGPACIEDSLDRIIKDCLMLIERKAPCQNQDEEDEEPENEDDEDVDHDELLTGNLFEFVQDVAKVCGDPLVPKYKPILTALMKYLKPSRPEGDWMMSIGTFAELLKYLPSIIPEYAPKLLPLCYKYCTSGDDDISRNSAYCIGIICELNKTVALPNLHSMLSALKNVYELTKSQEPKDNAISSLLRIIVSFPDKAPLELVLPAVFNNIPLNGDVPENINIAKSLAMLSPDIYKSDAKYLENSLLTCARVIVDEECNAEDDVKTVIGKHLARMSTIPEAESLLRGIIGKMNTEQTQLLQKFVVQG